MLDVMGGDSTAEARRSRELKDSDLPSPAKDSHAKTRKQLTVSTFSESGYGSADDLDSSRTSKTSATSASLVAASVTSLPPPALSRRASPTLLSSDASFDEDVATILGAVVETKIITTVFEVSGGGLGFLVEDLEAELARWFRSSGMLVLASEMVWSVPASKRQPKSEIMAKEALFKALRANNKRVLDLKWPKRRLCSPLCLPESSTEEVSGKERGLGAHQGTYRRYYSDLLPVQHGDTGPVHSEYWAFQRSHCRPDPQRFLYGPRRDIEELRSTTLLALNVTAVTFA